MPWARISWPRLIGLQPKYRIVSTEESFVDENGTIDKKQKHVCGNCHKVYQIRRPTSD
jgi:transposase-like protein